MAIDSKTVLHGDAAMDKLRELLAEFPIAFMVTVHAGDVSARPIGVVGDHAAFDGSLWFLTDRRSRKVGLIKGGCVTSLLFQDDTRGAYLSMSGRATVVDDSGVVKKLYTSVQRAWFPDGPDDPELIAVRFDAEAADYWDGHNSMVRLAVAMAKSIVTGSPGKSGNAGVARLKD
jgi:general stress protein 26